MINFLWILLISLGINYFFFIFAWIFKSDIFTDITYALTFIVVLWILFFINHHFNLNQILVFIVINCWAIRLAIYLFSRIIKIKFDRRFDNIRNSFVRFFGFWTIQSITVFLIIIPAIILFSYRVSFADSYVWTLFLIFIPLFGLIYETIADIQSNIFHKNKKNNEILNSGLWKFSRHPNYFGEILFWYGICILSVCTIVLTNKEYLILLLFLSPIYINIMLIYVSGIRMTEVRKIKNDPSTLYLDYVKNTPALIPFIGKKGFLYINKY